MYAVGSAIQGTTLVRVSGGPFDFAQGRLAGTPVAPLFVLFFALAGLFFFELALEGMFGTMAGLREIAVGAILHWVGVTVAELAVH